MKMGNIPGEFGFKAAYRAAGGWGVSDAFFFNKEEAIKCLSYMSISPDLVEVKWPVEINENGTVYVPDPSEFE